MAQKGGAENTCAHSACVLQKIASTSSAYNPDCRLVFEVGFPLGYKFQLDKFGSIPLTLNIFYV